MDRNLVKKIGTIDREGLSLSYTSLIPPTAKASVIILHGINDHRGRYLKLQEYLVKAGFANYAYDQRGFGLSGGLRTDIIQYQDFHDDLKVVVKRVRKEQPDQKIFLIGHSLGGAIAGTFCINFPYEVDALVLSAPAYEVPQLSLCLKLLSILLNKTAPTYAISYRSRSGTRSHDPAVDLAVAADPLIASKATPRFYFQFRKMNRLFKECADHILIPTLILQGGADSTIRPEGAKALYERLKNPDKKLLWYDGFYHEAFHEIGREKVVDDLIAWMKERCT